MDNIRLFPVILLFQFHKIKKSEPWAINDAMYMLIILACNRTKKVFRNRKSNIPNMLHLVHDIYQSQHSRERGGQLKVSDIACIVSVYCLVTPINYPSYQQMNPLKNGMQYTPAKQSYKGSNLVCPRPNTRKIKREREGGENAYGCYNRMYVLKNFEI